MKKEYKDDRIIYYDDNNDFLGHIIFEDNENVYHAISTVVSENARGQGIARKLVLDLIDLAKDNNRLIQPVCSYVVDFFDKNPEYNSYLNQ